MTAHPTLDAARIRQLLAPYLLDPITDTAVNQLGSYLDLLLKWNARTNLTAIRDPESIVRTHFGESLFAGQHLFHSIELTSNDSPPSLLDFGSGAGFPGLPIQTIYPQWNVTLAESQGKKSSFLREAVRTLALPTRVHAARVEDLPSETLFSAITMRAVDRPDAALFAALPRLNPRGILAILTTESHVSSTIHTAPLRWSKTVSIPESHQKVLLIGHMPR